MAAAGSAALRGASRANALLDVRVAGREKPARAAADRSAEPASASAPDAVFDLPPLEPLRPEIEPIAASISQSVLGRDRDVRLALACRVAGGHLLIDGPPGLGKTTLARRLAEVLGARMRRVQFTADLMPADILGAPVLDREAGVFRFLEGPIFTDVLLADEINRAPPRVQSALLEAMAEGRVTVDGAPRALPPRFFVVATRNPTSEIGAFPMPESELDRFLMRLSFGHLTRHAEATVLSRDDTDFAAVSSPETASDPAPDLSAIHVSDLVRGYVQDLLEASRADERLGSGLSIRAGLALMQAARAWTWLHGRDAAEPDDIQAVFPAVAGHRLLRDGLETPNAAAALLNAVPTP
ncbi:MAG: AAA family ATPase [Pseudomonadota bacterium]